VRFHATYDGTACEVDRIGGGTILKKITTAASDYPWRAKKTQGAGMIRLQVNGREHELELAGEMPLLWVLRDHLGLTGTKYGCGVAQCGACTVHVDGEPVRSCVTPLAGVAGSRVLTIEGLSEGRTHAVQQAWIAEDVPQCGFCQSGQIMAAAALLARDPRPDDAAIDESMAGNICRCGTYRRVRRAIKRAARQLRET
jgi:aerobic-type carbon monoxide dehydrogenase small subunit (CoxS/CutS family)